MVHRAIFHVLKYQPAKSMIDLNKANFNVQNHDGQYRYYNMHPLVI